MKDPRRWLELEQGVSALERRVLDAAARVAAPPGAKARVWAQVGGQIAASAAASASAAGAPLAAKSALSLAAVKVGVVGLLVGTTVVAGSSLLAHSPDSTSHGSSVKGSARTPALPPKSEPLAGQRLPATPAPFADEAPRMNTVKPRLQHGSSTSSSSTESQSDVESARDAPVVAGGVSASRAAFPEPPPAPSAAAAPQTAQLSLVDRTRLESQRIADARALLRAGRPDGALTILEAVARDFPNGILAQEREALSVQALLASGQRALAAARARNFLTRYPNSPHAAAMRSALE